MSDVLSAPLDLDECEAKILALPPADCPVTNSFVPGFYIRQIRMPKGSVVASKIHRTRHAFHITEGSVSVLIDGKAELLVAPHVGITEPGTRRLLLVHSDCVWTTFHPNPDNGFDLKSIEERIIEPHLNDALGVTHAEMQQLHRAIHEPNRALTE